MGKVYGSNDNDTWLALTQASIEVDALKCTRSSNDRRHASVMAKVEPLDVAKLEKFSDGSDRDYEESSDDGSQEGARENWGSQIDFILSCIGYAVGLGNILRFPYMAGQNGGAAFMIPYFIMMIFAGLPTFYLELALGQYSQVTPWLLYRRMCPMFTGIGYTMVTRSFIVGVYYNVFLAWSLYYLFFCFRSTLPWSTCRHNYTSDNCYEVSEANCTAGQAYFRGYCVDEHSLVQSQNGSLISIFNRTYVKINPALDFNRHVLAQSDGIKDIGYPKWDLALALLICWGLCTAVLSKGVKTSGKVVYFTATFPYVILLILMIRGLTLDGASDGLHFYLSPNLSTLFTGKVWGDAAGQIFFSLSIGTGGLPTLASYNKFGNNILRDTLIVVFGNCATSVFAGFVIFPILGFIARILKQDVAQIAASGVTLGFVSYPYALTRLQPTQLWNALFFFMLLILGIDSQLVIVEVVISSITDRFPKLHSTGLRKFGVVVSVCMVMFFVGLVFVTGGGVYLLNMIDTFGGSYPLLFAALPEVLMVTYFYGLRRFIADIQMMLGQPPNMFWRILGYPTNIVWWACWAVITPLLLFVTLVYTFIGGLSKPFEAAGVVYPIWANYAGWGITLLVASYIPIFAVISCLQSMNKHQGCMWAISPSQEWGPQDRKLRKRVDMEHPMRHLWLDTDVSIDQGKAYPGGYEVTAPNAIPTSFRQMEEDTKNGKFSSPQSK